MIAQDDIEAFRAMLTDAELEAAATLARVAERVERGVVQHREITAAEMAPFIAAALVGWSKAFDLMRQQQEAARASMAAFDRAGRETS